MPARHFHNHLPDYAPGNQVAVNVAHTLQTFSAVLQDVLKAPIRKPSVYTGVGGMPLARAPRMHRGEGLPLDLLQYADGVSETTNDRSPAAGLKSKSLAFCAHLQCFCNSLVRNCPNAWLNFPCLQAQRAWHTRCGTAHATRPS